MSDTPAPRHHSREQVTSFDERLKQALSDPLMKENVFSATYQEHDTRLQMWAELGSIEQWRERASAIRADTLAHLDRYLEQMANSVEQAGGHVYWAGTAEEATGTVVDIAQRAEAELIVKSKSMVTEEIDLNEGLEAVEIEVVETDLGQYILQLAGEKPSHLVAPAVHKSKEQVRELFGRVSGQAMPDDADVLNAYARQQLRDKFLNADVGISGANFVVAESGTVVLVTNEGNGRMVTSLPPVHIVVMGMERVVPTFADLSVLLELLPRSATGQRVSTYVSMLTGRRRPTELDGPEELHLVVVDNGRSKLLGSRFWEALKCIRCGACLNACPVYRNVGGHAYGGVYSGPIGAVISPLLDGLEVWSELPFLSSLCGACDEACPVMVPLHEYLRDLREEMVNHNLQSAGEKLLFKAWARAWSNPTLYRLSALGARFAQLPFKHGDELRGGPNPLSAWTKSREFPAVADQPFHKRWHELALQDREEE